LVALTIIDLFNLRSAKFQTEEVKFLN